MQILNCRLAHMLDNHWYCCNEYSSTYGNFFSCIMIGLRRTYTLLSMPLFKPSNWTWRVLNDVVLILGSLSCWTLEEPWGLLQTSLASLNSGHYRRAVSLETCHTPTYCLHFNLSHCHTPQKKKKKMIHSSCVAHKKIDSFSFLRLSFLRTFPICQAFQRGIQPY